jgi:hypothetical protein
MYEVAKQMSRKSTVTITIALQLIVIIKINEKWKFKFSSSLDHPLTPSVISCEIAPELIESYSNVEIEDYEENDFFFIWSSTLVAGTGSTAS